MTITTTEANLTPSQVARLADELDDTAPGVRHWDMPALRTLIAVTTDPKYPVRISPSVLAKAQAILDRNSSALAEQERQANVIGDPAAQQHDDLLN